MNHNNNKLSDNITERKNKKYRDRYIPFSNDYMFCFLLSSNTQLAKELLELILNIEVDHVEVIDAQKILNYSLDSHSVRLDVYLKNSNDVFDVEMQNIYLNDFSKRMRYYHSAIACEDLERGDDYSKLKNCYVIFLCRFDPFKKGEAIYRFTMRSDRHQDLELNDGAYNIILNCESNDENISPGLKHFLKYINEGIAVDNFTSKIQNEVDRINNDPHWRKNALTIEESMNIRYKLGKDEGFKLGKTEGDFFRVVTSIESLLSKGIVNSEEEACDILSYDYEEYLKKKDSL